MFKKTACHQQNSRPLARHCPLPQGGGVRTSSVDLSLCHVLYQAQLCDHNTVNSGSADEQTDGRHDIRFVALKSDEHGPVSSKSRLQQITDRFVITRIYLPLRACGQVTSMHARTHAPRQNVLRQRMCLAACDDNRQLSRARGDCMDRSSLPTCCVCRHSSSSTL